MAIASDLVLVIRCSGWQLVAHSKSKRSPTVAKSFRQLRRGITQLAIRMAIDATRPLPIGLQRSSIRRMVVLAGSVPMLRWRVREQMRLALGDAVPLRAERRYFQRVGWFLSTSLATFHRGLAATPVVD